MGIDLLKRKNHQVPKFKIGHKEFKRYSPDKAIKLAGTAVLTIATVGAVKKLLE